MMKKSEGWKEALLVILLLIGVGFFLKYAFFSGLNPLSVNLVLSEPLPYSFGTCQGIGGGCVPPEQLPVGTLEYGTCGSDFKCVVPDLCDNSGGVYNYTYDNLTNTYEKKCLCKVPSKYDVRSGCVTPLQ